MKNDSAVDRFTWERHLLGSVEPPTRKLVLLALASFVNKRGVAFPTQQQLAEACGLTPRAIRSHLAAAIECGWVERTRVGRSGVASEYVLKLSTAGTAVPPPTGTQVPLGERQAEREDAQAEPDDTSTGTGVPTNMYQHVDTTLPEPPRTGAPLEHHLKALRWGRDLAASVDDEAVVREKFANHKTFSQFAGLLDVVLDHWSTARAQQEARTA